MATAPTSRRLNLTRDQLASFLTDQQQIRQFELLLTAIDALTGENVAAGQVYAGPPIGSGPPTFRALQKSDLPASSLADLDDVDVTTVVDGQLLRYDATTEKWVNSVGVTVSETGEINTDQNLLITNQGSDARGVAIDGKGFGSFLILDNSITGERTELFAQDSGVILTSEKIELYSSTDVEIAAGVPRSFFLSGTNGFLSIGIPASSTPTAQLDISNNTIRLRNSRTPASASASGNRGDICWDANYIYVCVATNTWKRTAISTW
jgi:hypothetical protein